MRIPIYDKEDNQIGIMYHSDRTHLNDMCEGYLIYAINPQKYMRQCVWGVHEWEQEYELDDYVGGHAVRVPTGRMRCKNCGEMKANGGGMISCRNTRHFTFKTYK